MPGKIGFIRAMMDRCRPIALKIFRYGGVGILAALGYMGIAAFFIEVAGISPFISSVMGFLLALPISYFGHRNWTFRSNGVHSWQVPRFAVSAAFVFAVSSLSMAILTERFGLHYGVTFSVTIVAAVVFNFAVFELWIFRTRSPKVMHTTVKRPPAR